MNSPRCLARIEQVALVCILIVMTAGATDSSARFNRDSHEIMCVCGCNELLGECNHVGCPDSNGMLTRLAASIAHGDSDSSIFRQFQQQYGPIALASPRFTRFNHIAWIMPPLVLLLGMAGVFLLVRNWKMRTVPMPATPDSLVLLAARDRIRRETRL